MNETGYLEEIQIETKLLWTGDLKACLKLNAFSSRILPYRTQHSSMSRLGL